MKTIIKKLVRVSNLGIDSSLSLAGKRRISLTNIFTMVGITFTCIYLPCYWVKAEWVIMGVALLVFGMMGLSLLLNANKKYLPARYLTVFAVCLILFVQGIELGRASYVQMIYLPIFVGMIAIFDYSRTKFFMLGLCIPLVFLLALEIVDYGAAFNLTPAEGNIDDIYYLNLISTITGSMAVLYFLISAFRKQTDLLENQAAELHESQESLIQTSRIAQIAFTEINLRENNSIWGQEIRQILGVNEDFSPKTEHIFQIIHPEDRQRVRDIFRKARVEKEDFLVTFRIIRQRDNEVIFLKTHGRVICDAEGNAIKMPLVLKNITAEKLQATRFQQEKERAEEAALAKTLFLSNISHEIRTPLNGLLGFAQLLAKSELTEAQRKHLSLLQYSGETLEALLNDLLDITRIEQGKLKLNEEVFDLQKLASACCAPYELQATEKGLGLQLNCSLGKFPVINSDPLRIKQILINLVNNAIKYADQGKIEVHISVVEEENTSLPLQLKMVVQDAGPGIPQHEQESIFQTFTQVNSALPEAQSGLGLGLSIVHNLVGIMGGSISIESPIYDAPNSPGTRFTCYLPTLPGKLLDEPQTVSEIKMEEVSQMKVLVAEDNEINQILIQTILEDTNFSVLMVENGQEAVDVALSTKVDLVLMDVQMPIMDGYEATRKIRIHKPHLPIVALSANAFEEDIQKSFEAGMNGHLSKPLQIKELYTSIYSLFGNRQVEKV